MAIYMKVPGVDGAATAKEYKNWIPLESMQFGVGRAIDMTVGDSKNRESTRPSFSEITVSKQSDDASTGLFKESILNSAGKTIEIVLCRTNNDKIEEYMKYTLTDALISSFSMSSGGDIPSESISLSYVHLEVAYTTRDAKGGVSGPVRVAYDLAKGTKG